MNRVLLFMIFFLICEPLPAVTPITDSVSFELLVNVSMPEPVCKLSATNKTIDFGEVDVIQISKIHPVGTVTYDFTDCMHVSDIEIAFSGPNIDTNTNTIRNGAGNEKASGIAIKLSSSSSQEIDLVKNQNLKPDSSNRASFMLNAELVPADDNVKPGLIDTSVTLEITYK